MKKFSEIIAEAYAGQPVNLTKESYEDDERPSPDEMGMAMSQLRFMQYAADEIEEYLEKGAAFPEWFQNKLTKTYNDLKDLHAYMHGENEDLMDDDEDDDEDEEDEE